MNPSNLDITIYDIQKNFQIISKLDYATAQNWIPVYLYRMK